MLQLTFTGHLEEAGTKFKPKGKITTFVFSKKAHSFRITEIMSFLA
jgi:hypothetical protein